MTAIQSKSSLDFVDAENSHYPRYLKRLITFEADVDLNVANLSRVNPSLLTLLPPVTGYQRQDFAFKKEKKAVLCIMVGICQEDRTDDPQLLKIKNTNKYQKYIHVVPITLEAERFVATIAVVTKTNIFHGQATKNIIQFSTIPGPLPYQCELFVFFY
jgi:hypothetical protein